MPLAYSNVGKWRRARTTHTCDHCRRSISPGERYWEYLGETPAYESGDPYCVDCVMEGRLGQLVDPATNPDYRKVK